MRITTDHPASSYGVPVILDDAGELMDYGHGIREALSVLGWTRREFADRAGKSLSTIDRWLYADGTVDPVALYILRDAIEGG